MALMCQGRLEFDAIETVHGIRIADYFAAELESPRGMADAGLVEVDERAIQVTPSGWFMVRAVAMVFDRHLQVMKERRRFSKIV